MTFKFHCPHCDQRISATTEYIGSESTCPTCSQPFVVPAPFASEVSTETQVQNIQDMPATGRSLETVKAIGGCAIWFAVMIGIVFVAGMLIRGGVWASDKIYPWLVVSSLVSLAVSILALLPLALFKETRGHSGLGFYIVSFVFGGTLWVWSLLLTYVLWGGVALFIGLILAGVGVLPIALLATATKGMWSMFGQLILGFVATYGTRSIGIYLMQRAEEEQYEDLYMIEDQPLPLKLIVTTWLLFASSFMGVIGYITIIPFLICSIILCCSKARRARRHGQILLLVFALLSVAAFCFGWFFPDLFPDKK